MLSLLEWGYGKKNEMMTATTGKLQVADVPNHTMPETSPRLPVKRKRTDSEASITAQGQAKLGKMLAACMNHLGTGKIGAMPGPDVQKTAAPHDHDGASRRGEVNGTSWEHKMENHRHPTLPSPTHTIIPEQTMMECDSTSASTQDSSRLSSIQQTIEAQFSLEILLKHNELRLIDQELAKCQAAMEQLRRCQVIPYPASTSHVEDMFAVTDGVGAARITNDGPQPEHPPPWGVTDGPYSRHYARWLLPDAHFDGGPMEDVTRPHVGQKGLERATRGGKVERSSTATKGRAQRGSAGSRLQALPAGYPEPKEEKGPMIVKRSTDGKMVKLVCIDCRRENFNSAQGFINHCRIAHGRGFASHDAATLACGEDLEFDEAGAVVLETGASAGTAGLVHPLIRSAHLASMAPSTSVPTVKQKKASVKPDQALRSVEASGHVQDPAPTGSKVTPVVDKYSQVPFVPSPSTPHLSALFAKCGRGGDLREFVTEATTKTDLNALSSGDEGSDYEMGSTDVPDNRNHLSAIGPVRGGRLPTRAAMSPAPSNRPVSSKGIDRHRTHKPQYINTTAHHDYATPYTSSPQTTLLSSTTPPSLSPATLETHPAPSLVSDDDDDDYEEEHSASETPSEDADDEDEDRYVDIEVADVEGGGPSVDPELRNSGKARAHGARPRRRSVLPDGVVTQTGVKQGVRKKRRME